MLSAYPFLLDEAMDEGLAGLAEAATDQGEFAVGQAFERARIVLGQLRQTLDQAAAAAPPPGGSPGLPAAVPPHPQGWPAARRALLALDAADDLPGVLARHPELAEPAADAWLADDEQALRAAQVAHVAQLVAEARAILRGERQ